MKLTASLPISFCFALALPVSAQIGHQRSLQWADNISTIPNAGSATKQVAGSAGERPRPTDGPMVLKDAYLDTKRDDLPIWTESIPLPVGTATFNASLTAAVYEPVPQVFLDLYPALRDVGAEPVVTTSLGMIRKVPHGQLSVEPYRRDRAGRIERLVSFHVDIVQSSGQTARPKSYPAVSKLVAGSWFRVTVPTDGVYKVTYDLLRDMGMDMNNLSSDRINVYGSHFGQLPFTNIQERPTDMLLNAITVEDGGDGQFGPNDHLLFYATGPHRWDRSGDDFVHTKNAYSDSASYFIGIDVDPPKRTAQTSQSSETPTTTVTSFKDRQFIEFDLLNLLKSGRTWFGDLFDLTLTYNYSFSTPFLVPGSAASIRMTGAARTIGTSNSSSFVITSGSNLNETFTVGGVPENYTSRYAYYFNNNFPFNPSGNTVPLTITFNKFNPVSSIGWLDYLELNCQRQLRMVGSQMIFRDPTSVAAGQISEFVLDQAQSIDRIWETSDPTNVRYLEYTTDGAYKRFTVQTDSLREFIAFRNSDVPAPTPIGQVPAQNLHATPAPMDLVIVCPPQFQGAASRLAERRISEGLNVIIVSPQQVYNEFSCGARDATAIKRYMRMLYDKATTPEEMPRYLLLFGDGSYNNLSQAQGNQNFIPSYQTKESLIPAECYVSDDYFGLLDATEGESEGNLVDIGIGRFPVSSTQMAEDVVNKILAYDQLKLLSLTGSACSETGEGGLADWRTHVLFTSDDQEGDRFEGVIHMSQCDALARRVESEYPQLNVEKVYLDAYQQISTPGGERYPQAAAELRQKVEKGLLLVNYVGHGGEVGWAHERFLDNSTILDWRNGDRLPLFMTATCEFTRWDDPGRTSAGEYVFLNPSGGGIALMTTSRIAYSSQNNVLANEFFDHIFEPLEELGRLQRLGDVYRETKGAFGSAGQYNHRNFVLVGDPSMRLALPRGTINITSVTDTMGVPVDTLKALSTVRIEGFVDNGSGQPMEDFNGKVVPIIYDKSQQQFTLANDGGTPFSFYLRNNVIYKGRASVNNGSFGFTFVVPKDINYEVGNGRISCYAESMSTNAVGYDNEQLVGGTATDVATDEIGPRIDLFINDDNFVRGGLTDDSPLLYSKLFDENGINTVGSSIGHDLLAVLDENTEQAVVLNDLYEADLDTYKSGEVRYKFKDLPEGSHTLRLKAWDVFNNSSESTTEFVVAATEELALDHVLNYPNPFTTHTEFYFEHNRPCTDLDAQVQVFTVSGRLVKTISRRLNCNGYRSEGLAWDGNDDFGDKLGRGVYVYRVNVATLEGERAEKFEKLVILR
ncbi:MAG: type IX secretion system sortase PorU [Flavobacteriales bacterium]|nr:type IX secretion system sortase PorU [Flavobacteriales bacterium]MBP7155328.1 type IX secretion system sortase PorU [Flavobacteriales bacterium]HQV74329.1 type IX secretion system sortase PorU [Flavobacteriales bacterium]HQW40099.1 type IX secretion system sortase PorU [Flavobacteriales bacterium]